MRGRCIRPPSWRLRAWILWRSRTQRRYLQLLPPLIFGVAFASVFYAPSFLHGDIFTQEEGGFVAHRSLPDAIVGDYFVIGCAGGGSNFAGIAFPFLRERLNGAKATRFLAVEPSSCPSLTEGEYRYDFGDTAGTTPLLKMHTLGNDFRPAPIHAGGLRYHGMAPMVSHLYDQGYLEAKAYPQDVCFEAALQFARTEGLIPAPESSHAIRAAIDEAIDAREAGEERVILFNLSGHGHFDMGAYDEYLAGSLA